MVESSSPVWTTIKSLFLQCYLRNDALSPMRTVYQSIESSRRVSARRLPKMGRLSLFADSRDIVPNSGDISKG